MISYLILPHPGVNAVFFDASQTLSLAELSICLRRLDTPCAAPRAYTLAGVRFYAFDAPSPLPPEDIRRLSRLSSLYALFATEGDLLRPIACVSDRPFGDDLSAILKYTGKTNVLFTRLMLHVAELSLRYTPKGRLSLLDPVAGKGTTLYEALMRGWDAAGIEIVSKAAHEAAVYFQKYLETEKWKHRAQKAKIYGMPSWRYTFARDKESLKSASGEWVMVAGDAKHADHFFGKAAFDIIAGDLPYGVSHGNIVGSRLIRTPKGLLENCLPAWHAALRPGGVLALSFNNLLFATAEMDALLFQNGFEVIKEPPYDAFAHRVDASIRRDIVIGVKC